MSSQGSQSSRGLPQCGICLEESLNSLSALDCGHVFHTKCINELKKSKNNSCPLCRHNIKFSIELIYEIKIEKPKNKEDDELLDGLLAINGKLESEKNELLTQIENFSKLFDELEKNQQELIKNKEKLVENSKKYKNEISSLQVQLDNSQIYNEELEQKIKDLNTKLSSFERLKKQYANLYKINKSSEDLEKELTANEKETEEINKKLVEMTKRNDYGKTLGDYVFAYIKKIKKLEDEISDLRKQLSSFDSSVNADRKRSYGDYLRGKLPMAKKENK